MITCLLVPSLALASELSEREGLIGTPVALTDESGTQVIDATEEAGRRGVRAGMTVREATAYCPTLSVIGPRPARVARKLDQLAAALHAVSPLVEVPALADVMAGPGRDRESFFADLRGTEALYSGMDEIATLVLGEAGRSYAPLAQAATTTSPTREMGMETGTEMAGEGATGAERAYSVLAPRLGFANRRFTAYAAARSARPGSWEVAHEDAAHQLAPLPVEWLPLEHSTIEQLHLLGITRVGAFAALPRHAVEAQFGSSAGRAWMAASDADPSLLRTEPFQRERVIERAGAEPALISREAILASAEQLLRRALRNRQVRRRFVRLLRVRATTEDDRLWERHHTMKEPTGDGARLWLTVRGLLERAEYPGPIAELELELSGLTSESGKQTDLFAERIRRREQLDEMVRHLKLRYGQSPVAHVVEVEPWSRIPERRHALMDYEP